MEKYTNEYGKECYKAVNLEDKFSKDMFHKVYNPFETDEQFALHTNLGSITVVDRLTGFSGYVRDTETGFRDMDGKFWLASGMLDVRESGESTFGGAIQWIKDNANTCNPDREYK